MMKHVRTGLRKAGSAFVDEVRGGPRAASVPVTVSIGVALCTRGDSAETVLKRADAAMYLAKQNGRNRVEVVASPVPI